LRCTPLRHTSDPPGTSKTIHGCVDRTGLLHVQRRCGRGQSRLVWNEQGPQGRAGAQGAPGARAITVWGAIASNSVLSGQGLTLVGHPSPGVYQLQVTSSACPSQGGGYNPVVSVIDGNPPVGSPAGSAPMAWATPEPPGQPFTVYTGVLAAGAFTPSDRQFNVIVPCS
jgi:hypothetical protein